MFNQLMRLMGRFRRWLTQVWDKFMEWVDPPPPPRSNPPRLPDDEYEWLFRQLLTKVGQGWKGDQVRRWLRRNEYRVTKSRWEEWSPRFHPNPKDAEISRQLLLLAQLDGDYISQIAANLLGETRPKPPPRETNTPPVTPPHNQPPTSTDSLPADAESWFNDGCQRLVNGDLRGAIFSWEKAIEFKPDLHEAAQLDGDYISQIAANLLGETRPKPPPRETNTPPVTPPHNQPPTSTDSLPADAESWFNDGCQRLVNGDWRGAIFSWEKAIEFKPDYHQAWYNRGVALSDLGEYEKAISSYDQAIKDNPMD
ncbi:tetratricopeptide repeat protein [Limnospira platensis CENA597]|uniref:tetratricopeptide repeat protein n=1 Tax=Limnospira platensis TaxID=118562 RepID=UPI003DA02972